VTMGLSNAFGSLGRIFGPPLGGVVFDLDWRLPFIGAAATMAAGFLVSYRVPEIRD
jgi:MFS family permease